MKSTGIVRKIDQLGRIVIPQVLRGSLDLKEGDPMEVFVENDIILLKKHQANNTCIITGDISNKNMKFGSGLVLSSEGAEILLQELKTIQNQ